MTTETTENPSENPAAVDCGLPLCDASAIIASYEHTANDVLAPAAVTPPQAPMKPYYSSAQDAALNKMRANSINAKAPEFKLTPSQDQGPRFLGNGL